MIDDTLSRLGLILPSVPRPVGSYVLARKAGDLMFLCGVLPFKEGRVMNPGKLGRDLSIADGVEASRQATLNALAILRQELGNLDRVKCIVRLTGYIASGEGFVDQPAVLNGASDLLAEIFGEAGRHARSALGVFELPLHAPVELEFIVQILPG